MAYINATLSEITLNVKGLNVPTKKQRLAYGLKKNNNIDPTICCLQETHFRFKDTKSLKVKIWKKIYTLQIIIKRAKVAIVISDKRQKLLLETKGHFYNVYYQKDMTIIKILEARCTKFVHG